MARGTKVLKISYFSLSRSPAQKVMRLYRWDPLIVSHHPAKFAGYRPGGGADLMVLVCYVILQDQVIKGL